MSETAAAPQADTSVRGELERAFTAAEERTAPPPRDPPAPKPAAESPAPVAKVETRDSDAGKPEGVEPSVMPSGDRPRDQFGRFQRTKDAPDAPAAEAAPEPVSRETNEPDQPEATREEPETAIAPPAAWSAAARTEWHQLPRTVQEEIQRRESDVQRGFRERAEQTAVLEPIAQALQPYQQDFALKGISPASAVQQLLAVRALLERDPIQGVAYVARSYNVDLRTFAEAFQPQQPQDPNQRAVNDRMERMETYLRQQQEAFQQRERGQIQVEIDQFAADREAHPYFEAVRPAMAQLMGQGIQTTLQEAYDHACWAIPEIRNRILADQRSAENQNRIKAEREAAEKARRAAVSVATSPHRGNGAAQPGNGKSIRDELEAAYDAAARA